MICPKCQKGRLYVIDTRPSHGFMRRRYNCNHCGYKVSSIEMFFFSNIEETAYKEFTFLREKAEFIKDLTRPQVDAIRALIESIKVNF